MARTPATLVLLWLHIVGLIRSYAVYVLTTQDLCTHNSLLCVCHRLRVAVAHLDSVLPFEGLMTKVSYCESDHVVFYLQTRLL